MKIDPDSMEACQLLAERCFEKFVGGDKFSRGLPKVKASPLEVNFDRLRAAGFLVEVAPSAASADVSAGGRSAVEDSLSLQAARVYERAREGVTQREVGRRFGVSQACVSQGLKRLRYERASARNLQSGRVA